VTGPWIALVISLTVLVMTLAVLVLGLMRRVVPLLESEGHRHYGLGLSGLAPGDTVPPFEAREPDGTVLASDRLLERSRVLLFMSASCQPCRTVAADLRTKPEAAALPLLVVLPDEPQSHQMDLPASAPVVFERDRAASDAFRNSAVPHAYAVDAAGVVIRAAPVQGLDDLRALADALPKGGDTTLEALANRV
jgi:hypothetical protein